MPPTPPPTGRRHKRRWIPAAAAVGVVVGSTVLAGAGSALASGGHGSGSYASVPQGAAAAPLDGVPPEGSTPASTPVSVSFILKANDLSQLENKVDSGWSGRYLTTSQFAQQYGQSPQVVTELENYLDSFGLTTSAYSDGLDVRANGTAGQVNKALSVTLQNFSVRSPAATPQTAARRSTVHASRTNPQLPSNLANAVLCVLGLSNYAPFDTDATKALATKQGGKLTGNAASVPPGELLPANFTADYGLDGLLNNGATGAGRTIGIVTLASIEPSDAFGFWNTYLGLNEPASRLTLENVDGGAGPVSGAAGSVETTLDVEQSGAIARGADIHVYQAPNTDNGFADAFFDAASENLADTVSTSWGESETIVKALVGQDEETPQYQAAFDEAFLEMAAQGQSNFAATGDYGAYQATSDLGTTNLAVGLPAASPYITAAGGTTLPATLSVPEVNAQGAPTGVSQTAVIPREMAWNYGYLWPLYQALGIPGVTSISTAADALANGDNGGYSTFEPEPSYQHGLVNNYQDREYLHPTAVQSVDGLQLPTQFNLNESPALKSGTSAGARGVPDVSTDADPDTGYAVYSPTLFGSADPFAQYGGTSFVAPQLNGSTAVIDSALGRRVGFWNPAIYSFAQGTSSPFTPLNSTKVFAGKKYLYQTSANGTVTALPGSFSNDNLYYTGDQGQLWTPAVGLGTPNLTALANDFYYAEGRH